ncbi:hypothetical protein I302_100261 [Kwoniella bestiolae CBS 10118]|uniref:Uncharacterized protein n=1 Tax=Kwoniella bestiolae CBS 10118 TaxID=1296100 RepID=A0AAJ8K033_9TREE
MTPTKQRKSTILFITPPEAGQANCHLAVISSLKAKHGENVDIHLASFAHLKKRVSEWDNLPPYKGGEHDARSNERMRR